MREEKYQIIYADPPWEYKKSVGVKSARGLAKAHYNTMKIEDIKALPIQEIADKDCCLFLWATFPCLQEGLDVIKAWGFRYSSVAFVWVKKNKRTWSNFWGMGNWTRANAEVCLLGLKGKPKRQSAKVHSVIEEHIMQHSKKPEQTRDRIVELCGDLPRVELFAREATEGWDVWGNEVESNIKL